MKIWTKCVTTALLAIALAIPTSFAMAQDDEGQSREQRLRAIEEAIERIELQIPYQDVAELLEQAQEEFGEFQFEWTGEERYMIGITLNLEGDDEGEEHVGLVVGEVMEDMPAAEAGVESGDQIVAVNGEEVEEYGDLVEAIQESGGEKLTLVVVRGDRKMEIEVTPVAQGVQGFEVPHFEFDEEMLQDLEIDPSQVIPHFREWQDGVTGGLRIIPPVEVDELDIQIDPRMFIQPQEVRGELDEIREEMEQLREQMKELSEQLKELTEALGDR